MAQIDQGPASGNASYFVIFREDSTVEFHAPTGANSLAPVDAPLVGPQNPSGITPVFASYSGVRFAIPA